MRNWFQTSVDPKEVFPIENLPLETLEEKQRDAIGLLYKKTKESKDGGRKLLPHTLSVDQQKEDFFRRILPILDGFDNIFRHANTSNIEQDETLSNWMKTLETLYRRLISALEKEGLVAIESVGSPLDLSIHEVVDIREDPSTKENIVVEELVKGYKYGRRVLRDAKVIVSKKPKE